jgi:hypothetical protein
MSATTIGINFRGTEPYVTDGADQTFCLAEGLLTRVGWQFGWIAGTINGANRTTLNDVSLAGMNYGSSGTFQVTLPSATDYLIGLAIGDTANQNDFTATLKDDTTTLATLGPHPITANSYWDASDVERTAAAWPGSQALIQKTFATTTLKLVLTDPGNFTIAHLFVSQVVSGSATRPPIIGGGYYG